MSQPINNSWLALPGKLTNWIPSIFTPNSSNATDYDSSVLHAKMKEAWNKNFGTTEEMPPVPQKLIEALNKPCPFTYFKKVKDTHVVMYFPHLIDGDKLTIDRLPSFTKKTGVELGYKLRGWFDFESLESDTVGGTAIKNGYWALVFKNTAPGSNNKNNYEQVKLLDRAGYQNLRLMEILTTAQLQYALTKEHLFGLNTSQRFFIRTENLHSTLKHHFFFVLRNHDIEQYALKVTVDEVIELDLEGRANPYSFTGAIRRFEELSEESFEVIGETTNS